MNEFKFLIHKRTGKCIDYKEYQDKVKNEELIKWKDKIKNRTWQYDPKTILSNDDFAIMHDSEFEKEGLEKVLSVCIECLEESGQLDILDKLIKKFIRY